VPRGSRMASSPVSVCSRASTSLSARRQECRREPSRIVRQWPGAVKVGAGADQLSPALALRHVLRFVVVFSRIVLKAPPSPSFTHAQKSVLELDPHDHCRELPPHRQDNVSRAGPAFLRQPPDSTVLCDEPLERRRRKICANSAGCCVAQVWRFQDMDLAHARYFSKRSSGRRQATIRMLARERYVPTRGRSGRC
jgi:hypothetical protein